MVSRVITSFFNDSIGIENLDITNRIWCHAVLNLLTIEILDTAQCVYNMVAFSIATTVLVPGTVSRVQ